ncbi:hypothetical protein Y1Q_0021818 [Alligator mississippiensis]|uniref:Uncharacterized protein n=1 Tax=Alligator mississippiensis TaxID=8496 RepID=A0A151PB73_ALLMI|nr:hypothetical protein Y1Q_0021818 [Alligator mississippiensis]
MSRPEGSQVFKQWGLKLEPMQTSCHADSVEGARIPEVKDGTPNLIAGRLTLQGRSKLQNENFPSEFE